MLLLSKSKNFEVQKILEDCFSVTARNDQEIVMLPSCDLFLLMDLSGKLYEEPVILLIKSARSFYLSKNSTFLFLRLPDMLCDNSYIEVSEGEYGLDNDWAMTIYGEMIEELHAKRNLKSSEAGKLMNWAHFNAHKEYTQSIHRQVKRLQSFITHERIDSRAKRREFQKVFGRSPQQMKLTNRFNRSLKIFLDTNQVPIEEYSDQAHWVRECKKYAGLTPSELKKLFVIF